MKVYLVRPHVRTVNFDKTVEIKLIEGLVSTRYVHNDLKMYFQANIKYQKNVLKLIAVLAQ